MALKPQRKLTWTLGEIPVWAEALLPLSGFGNWVDRASLTPLHAGANARATPVITPSAGNVCLAFLTCLVDAAATHS